MTTSKASSVPAPRSIAPAERRRLGRGADLQRLPRAFGEPAVSGTIRARPQDFVVDEELSFPLTGQGEHLYLLVRKTGQNTRWVARRLAERLHLPRRTIGFAGTKDRHAVTSQWFSAHLPGLPDPDPAALADDGIEVLQARRHAGKLRTGALRGNRFRIVARDLAGDRDALMQRLEAMRTGSVPNYFGAQRFGREARNLDLLCGSAAPPGRDARSFGLSALRSALFNLWLAQRMDAATWRSPLPGEILYRPEEHRFAHADRCAAGEATEPTGLLWGPGENQATGSARDAEQTFFDAFPDTCALLAAYEPRLMRRPLGLRVPDFEFRLHDDSLELAFTLSRGQFATAVMRELGAFVDSA